MIDLSLPSRRVMVATVTVSSDPDDVPDVGRHAHDLVNVERVATVRAGQFGTAEGYMSRYMDGSKWGTGFPVPQSTASIDSWAGVDHAVTALSDFADHAKNRVSDSPDPFDVEQMRWSAEYDNLKKLGLQTGKEGLYHANPFSRSSGVPYPTGAMRVLAAEWSLFVRGVPLATVVPDVLSSVYFNRGTQHFLPTCLTSDEDMITHVAIGAAPNLAAVRERYAFTTSLMGGEPITATGTTSRTGWWAKFTRRFSVGASADGGSAYTVTDGVRGVLTRTRLAHMTSLYFNTHLAPYALLAYALLVAWLPDTFDRSGGPAAENASMYAGIAPDGIKDWLSVESDFTNYDQTVTDEAQRAAPRRFYGIMMAAVRDQDVAFPRSEDGDETWYDEAQRQNALIPHIYPSDEDGTSGLYARTGGVTISGMRLTTVDGSFVHLESAIGGLSEALELSESDVWHHIRITKRIRLKILSDDGWFLIHRSLIPRGDVDGMAARYRAAATKRGFKLKMVVGGRTFLQIFHAGPGLYWNVAARALGGSVFPEDGYSDSLNAHIYTTAIRWDGVRMHPDRELFASQLGIADPTLKRRSYDSLVAPLKSSQFLSFAIRDLQTRPGAARGLALSLLRGDLQAAPDGTARTSYGLQIVRALRLSGPKVPLLVSEADARRIIPSTLGATKMLARTK